MKIDVRSLRKLISKELKQAKLKHIRESIVDSLEKENDSLDAQVDAYFVKLEKQSDVNDDMKVENILASKSLRFLLEDDEKAPKDNEGEKKADKATPSPKVKITRKTNVSAQEFANHIARLIENYDSLLDIRRTILVRALKYAQQNHSEQLASEMADILEREFDLTLSSDQERHDELVGDPPIAIGGNAKLA